MKDLLISTLLQIYVKATELARDNKQTVGEKRDYYITLEQLEALFNEYND